MAGKPLHMIENFHYLLLVFNDINKEVLIFVSIKTNTDDTDSKK